MAEKLFLVLENRFDCPPEYAAAWLQDVRPEDGRLFGREGLQNVEREGNVIRTSGPHPMGDQSTTITIEAPLQWTARTEMRKNGKVLMLGRVVETVRADGDGSIHRAEIYMDAKTLMTRLMAPMMRSMARKELGAGFEQMRAEVAEQYRAGKDPTA